MASINVIETAWGCIAEYGRDELRSWAMVVLDPDKEKPAEYHLKMLETFTPVFGIGFMRIGDNMKILEPGRPDITVPSGVDYTISNSEPDTPLCVRVHVTPPFDPADVYLDQ